MGVKRKNPLRSMAAGKGVMSVKLIRAVLSPAWVATSRMFYLQNAFQVAYGDPFDGDYLPSGGFSADKRDGSWADPKAFREEFQQLGICLPLYRRGFDLHP